MSGPPPLSINVKIAKTEVNTAQELREREKAAGRALQEEDTVTVQQNFSQSKEFIPENLVKTVSEGLASLDLKDGGTRSKKSVKVGPEDFEIRAVIGQGAYGRVLQVVQIKTKKIYAMKILQKGQVFKKKNVDYVKEERNILTKVDHPFVINLKCTFQTERKLYIVMEYAAGGELFNHLRNEGLFMEQTAAFYTAEIVLALEYLHYKGIIHRDLKPENVLLDETGHIRITDFGLAKVQEKDSTTAKTICGTDLYMAPEMLGGNGYGRAVDWWSLGTLLYEMLTGDPPFFARDTKKLYKKIMNEKPRFPRWLSSNCTSILKGLLTRNVEQRLGATRSTMFKVGGVQELKSHKFFKSIDWNKLFDKKVTPPHVPSITGGEADISNFDEKFTSQHVGGNLADFGGNSPKYKHHMDKAPDDAFAGFSFVRSSFLDALMGSKSPTTGDPESTFPTIYEAVNDENVVSTIDHPHANKNLVANDKFEETATNDDDGESAHDEDHGCFHMDLDQ